MHTVLQDLRYTFRQLRRAPGFTAIAILTLALGIGATITMFSIMRITLLAPLPYAHPEDLVGIGFNRSGAAPRNGQTGATADFLLTHARSFSVIGVAEGEPLGQNFSARDGRPEVIRSLHVSAGYLPALGTDALLGRTFTSEEDRAGAAPVAVLSEQLWRRTMNASPDVIGQVVHLNSEPYTVIGVVPSVLATIDSPDLWQPLQLSPKTAGYNGTNFQLVARLKPGVTLARAAAELAGMTDAIYREFPDYVKWAAMGPSKMVQRIWPLQQIVVNDARSSLLALSAAVLAVLLMACLNLASLATARSTSRAGEIAVRSALGARRFLLLRLLLTESLVLAFVGSLAGLVLAQSALPMLLKFSPVTVPQLRNVQVDGAAILFAMAVACTTTLIFGLVPAIAVFRMPILTLLGGTRTAGGSVPQQRLGRALVFAQVAVATLLLSAAAMLLATFLRMRAIPSGVRPSHLYALQVNLKGDAYSSSQHSAQFVTAVEERLRALPGVEQVSAVNGLPLDQGLNDQGGPISYDGNVEMRFVTPAYVRVAGMSLITGSEFTDADRAASVPVVMINERAAKLWFPDRPAVGEYVRGKQPRRIIGVVSNVHNSSLADTAEPTIYVPYAQTTDGEMKMINGWFATTFLLRTFDHAGPEPELARAATAAVIAVDPEVPASKFVPMQSFIDKTVAAPRFFSWLAGGFAGFALLLTTIGLFGLLSYQVGARTREMGVRIALGARRSQILTLVLRSGTALTLTGLIAGALGSFVLRSVIIALLADTAHVETADIGSVFGSTPTSILIAAGAMLLVATLASLIPARRAALIEPVEALRSE